MADVSKNSVYGLPEAPSIKTSKSVTIKKPHIKIKLRFKKLLFALFIVIVVSAVIASVAYLYLQYQKAQTEITSLKSIGSSSNLTPEQAKGIIDRVGKLVDLPTGEEPTVAVIKDASKLKSQAFFKNAQNGDIILIYQKAQKAYLYSIKQNKLLDVAPVSLGASPTPGTQTPAPSSSPSPSPFLGSSPIPTPIEQSAPSPTPTP